MRVLRLSAVVVLAVGLLSVANRVSAQEEEAPSQFEHIKGLQPLVGLWVGEEPEEEGQVQLMLVCRWTSNRSYLRMQLMLASSPAQGEPRPILGTVLIGKDHANDQVSVWGFWDDIQSHGKVEVGEGTLATTESGTQFDGRMLSFSATVKVDGDELTIDVTNRKIGDESLEDEHFTFTRAQGRGGRRGRGRGGRGGQAR